MRLASVPSWLNKELETAGVLSSDGDDGRCKFGIKASLILKKRSLIIFVKEREMEKDTYSGMSKIIKLDSSILACTLRNISLA